MTRRSHPDCRATVNKGNSDSALERGRWNTRSIANFFETYGVGAGLGSTRSSSWAISVIAQLGVIGAVAYGIVCLTLAYALARPRNGDLDKLAAATGAAALAGAVTTSFGGSGCDPGLIFFMSLAVVSAALTIQGSPTVRRAGMPKLAFN